MSRAPTAVTVVDQAMTWADRRPAGVAYMFMDYAAGAGPVQRVLTWSDTHRRAAALADRLRRTVEAGDRVAVLAPSGVEYVVALFASWYARTIAVPLFPPDLPGPAARLAACYDDCAPAAVLTTVEHVGPVTDFVKSRSSVLVVGDDAMDGRFTVDPDDVAYLQYTSGSTRTPAGVEITHRNLAANVRQLWTAFGGGRTRYTGVNWLPLFHDMGLLATVAMPLLNGTDAVFLDPAAFLMRPVRWLRLLSGRPAAYTAAPNFAYDYCLRRIGEADRAGLDLSGVFLWLNGGEPVDAGTMDRFAAAFRDAGVAPQALCAAYGLAEATAFVAADSPDRPPTVARFDRAALAAGHGRPAPTGGSALVSCGRPVGQEVAIVDGLKLPEDRVGEIWVRGPNVSRQHSPWLRTGDLGLLHDGQLYVTGRLKDLLILAGRNHYPQDIEATVASVSQGRVVAFGLPVRGQERAVVVAERSRSARWGEREVRAAVWAAHDLALHDVVLTAPGAIPRTSSGKLSRTACRQRYLAGDLHAG